MSVVSLWCLKQVCWSPGLKIFLSLFQGFYWSLGIRLCWSCRCIFSGLHTPFAEPAMDVIWVGLSIAFLPWQLAQCLPMLQDLVLRGQASRTSPAQFLQVQGHVWCLQQLGLIFKFWVSPKDTVSGAHLEVSWKLLTNALKRGFSYMALGFLLLSLYCVWHNSI